MVIHYDVSRAVEPLEALGSWEQGELPQTYPTALQIWCSASAEEAHRTVSGRSRRRRRGGCASRCIRARATSRQPRLAVPARHRAAGDRRYPPRREIDLEADGVSMGRVPHAPVPGTECGTCSGQQKPRPRGLRRRIDRSNCVGRDPVSESRRHPATGRTSRPRVARMHAANICRRTARRSGVLFLTCDPVTGQRRAERGEPIPAAGICLSDW